MLRFGTTRRASSSETTLTVAELSQGDSQGSPPYPTILSVQTKRFMMTGILVLVAYILGAGQIMMLYRILR